MSIVSRPLSAAGRANHERIFGKPKKDKKSKNASCISSREMVKYHPRQRRASRFGLKENVTVHKVIRGASPDDYEPPTIVFRGNTAEFKAEVQRAYDNHPDPAIRGQKVYLHH